MQERYKRTLRRVAFHAFMLSLTFIMIYPFLWSVLSSFKDVQQLYTENPLHLMPRKFILSNYHRLFEVLPFGRFLLNSVYLAIIIPSAMIFVASLTAYSLSRLQFKGRNVIFFMFVATMMLPGHVTLIPNYAVVTRLKLINTYWALGTSLFTAANAFNIFFFRQFFLTIPKDLENAAVIDGCSRFRCFFTVVLPNAKPAIATTAILSFRGVWNAFLWPMLVLNDYNKMTITVGLTYLKQFEANWTVLLAGASLSILPIIALFICFQRYFMSTNLGAGFGGK